MKTRAAVAFAPKQPLEIVELDLEGPKAGEVLVEIKATGICHTDAYTLDGFDSEGIFPSILGHEGAGIVREVGPGVPSVLTDGKTPFVAGLPWPGAKQTGRRLRPRSRRPIARGSRRWVPLRPHCDRGAGPRRDRRPP